MSQIGCSSGQPRTSVVGTRGGSGEAWFCEADETYNAWECIQDDGLAANPRPTRPHRPPPPDDPIVDGLLNQAPPEPAVPPQTASIPPSFPQSAREPLAGSLEPSTESAPSAEKLEPSAEKIEPSAEKIEPSAEKIEPSAEQREPSAETREPSDIPIYQQLAYQPDEAVQLIDLPADFYAVQILAMSSRQALEAYAEEHDLPSMAAARVARNGEIYYVLLLGVYRDKSTAEEAAAYLPERIMLQNPWVRSMQSLQEAIAHADRMASAADR